MNAPTSAIAHCATADQSRSADYSSASTRQARTTLPSSLDLKREIVLRPALQQRIDAQRCAIRAVIEGRDDRLLVVVGPCSIHDEAAALDYARRLSRFADTVSDRLLIVMRVYIEKPRTTVGWKGFAYDPDLDGSDDMARGLQRARRLMRDIVALGLPVATELLQPLAAQYIDDLVGWAAIGARTTESQIHRELASGFPAPVGFKNGTNGGIQVALDAMAAARCGHRFFGMGEQGQPAMMETTGNRHAHLVLRGGHSGPNCDPDSVAAACRALADVGQRPSLMIDCSHANSDKDPTRQTAVLDSVVSQRLTGNDALTGVMLESHLGEGRQAMAMGATLRYGVSITDGCLGWAATRTALLDAARRLRAGDGRIMTGAGTMLPG